MASKRARAAAEAMRTACTRVDVARDFSFQRVAFTHTTDAAEINQRAKDLFGGRRPHLRPAARPQRQRDAP